MKLEAKHEIGADVFVPGLSRVDCVRVRKISIQVTSNGNKEVDGSISLDTVVRYDMYPHSGMEEDLSGVLEDNVYKTKKAAARTVIRNMGYYVSEEDLRDEE